MPRIKTPNNLAIESAILAVARAHARYPGVTPAGITELATKIERVLEPHQSALCTAALCVLLLKAIGVGDAFNASRLVPQ